MALFARVVRMALFARMRRMLRMLQWSARGVVSAARPAERGPLRGAQ
jgi:hypothetical protein